MASLGFWCFLKEKWNSWEKTTCIYFTVSLKVVKSKETFCYLIFSEFLTELSDGVCVCVSCGKKKEIRSWWNIRFQVAGNMTLKSAENIHLFMCFTAYKIKGLRAWKAFQTFPFPLPPCVCACVCAVLASSYINCLGNGLGSVSNATSSEWGIHWEQWCWQ